jgi:hypothetical protein
MRAAGPALPRRAALVVRLRGGLFGLCPAAPRTRLLPRVVADFEVLQPRSVADDLHVDVAPARPNLLQDRVPFRGQFSHGGFELVLLEEGCCFPSVHDLIPLFQVFVAVVLLRGPDARRPRKVWIMSNGLTIVGRLVSVYGGLAECGLLSAS